MRPSKFIAHYERMLRRKLTPAEIAGIDAARSGAAGKRDAVRAMRSTLLGITPEAALGFRDVAKAVEGVPPLS